MAQLTKQTATIEHTGEVALAFVRWHVTPTAHPHLLRLGRNGHRGQAGWVQSDASAGFPACAPDAAAVAGLQLVLLHQARDAMPTDCFALRPQFNREPRAAVGFPRLPDTPPRSLRATQDPDGYAGSRVARAQV